MKARIRLQKDCIISPIDPRVFGSFIEHLGRAVYTGIYEPGHPTADVFGFRGDVEALIRPLHVTQIRYPGGNFLSGYDWRDGIGPKDRRPVRPDMAWSAIEPNQVGTDEFLQWCERIGAQPMMAVNLGTGTPKDAVELLEYCNGDMHTYWADKRRENGREAPYNVKLWCLGNEMDGPWQICSKTATEYGRIACETAKLMKMFDPTIETVACGSSYRTMPTFGTWEEEVLRQSYPYVDYLSLHQYYTNHEGDVMNFLARSEEMGEFIQEVAAICEKIRLEVGSDKHIGLSFDEWNVWYHYAKNGRVPEKWTVARPIEEENYDFADALLVGSMLNTLLNHADVVKVACLAQLVNALAPIMTEPGGRAWAQTTYWPFLYGSQFGRGTALQQEVEVPTYACGVSPKAPYLSSSAVLSEDGTHVTVFAVNKSLDEAMTLELDGLNAVLEQHVTLTAPSLDSENTADAQPALPREVAVDAEAPELPARLVEYAPLPPCLILKISPYRRRSPLRRFFASVLGHSGSFMVEAGHAPPVREAAKAAPIRCSVPFPAPCFLMCHCEEAEGRRGNLAGPGRITGHSRRKRNCLPEIAPQGHFLALRAQGATAPSGPRNDKSGAIAVLAIACANRQCSAGSGMPLPYNKGTIDSAPQKSKRSRPGGRSSPARIGGQGFFWISSPLSDSASE